MMKISAALIVKNEEMFLARCLDSIKDQVDEIIIVDTGSTDDTVNIAQKYTDKVYYYEWHDDFAAARNNACSYATGDYILSIDADEYLVKGGIKDEIDDSDSIWCKFTCEHDDNCIHTAPRIFKKGLQWIGKCHEGVPCNTGKSSNIEIKYGRSPSHDEDPDRNIRILESIENPDARDYYYLSVEFFQKNQFEKAVEYAEKCIGICPWKYWKADAYLTAARSLSSLDKTDKASDYCLKAIMLNPEFKEALYFMGEISAQSEKIAWERYAESATNDNVEFIRRK